jgi:4-hydroxybenzoate polyprenyltransferase
MKELFKALRAKQWVKNLFIFLPLIFGGKLFVFPANFNILIAFIIFCAASSAVYLVNDALDLKEDRGHPTKRLRSLAAGKISAQQAMTSALILGISAAVFSFLLDFQFGLIVTTYFCLNLLYSKILRNIVIIDVFCLAGFFLLRILSGGAVAAVKLSPWIIFMTVLLALLLGFGKRRQECKLLKKEIYNHRHVLAQYHLRFLDPVIVVLAASIVVMYTLYGINSGAIYSAPFVYYGVFRYLYLINKRVDDGDPAHLLFSDKPMQLDLLLWIACCVFIYQNRCYNFKP